MRDGRPSANQSASSGPGFASTGDLAERVQLRPGFVASERRKHARQVAGRGDRRAKSPPQRLSGRGSAEVVVAAGALRLRHDLELAGGACGADQGVVGLVEANRIAVDAHSLKID